MKVYYEMGKTFMFEKDKIKEILNKISKTNKIFVSKYNSKELTKPLQRRR
jgi:hypothetical protein